MSLDVAIIADDLTGALDCSSPFALQGRKVVTALHPGALSGALARQPDILVVSTGSRALPESEAAAIVHDLATSIRQQAPGAVAFKKIDSRLKGNVAAEVAAAAAAWGRHHILACPAVPDQNRPVIGGRVQGRGLPSPLAVADVLPPGAEIIDARFDHDLAPHLTRASAATLLVGARGLGQALARQSASPALAPGFAASRRTLFVIGSRDPISNAQIALLTDAHRIPRLTVGPDTPLPPLPHQLPLLIGATPIPSDPAAVARALAEAALSAITQLRPDTLVLSGGDTALAVLRALTIETIETDGEALSGLPWFCIPGPGAESIRCVVKSGGFGETGTLLQLLPQ